MYKLRLLYIPCVVRVQFRRVSGKGHIYLHSPLSEASLNCSHLFFRSLLLFMWNVEEMPCPSWEKESQRAQSSACFTCPTRWWPGARARWGPRALPALCTAASRGLRAAWRAVPRGTACLGLSAGWRLFTKVFLGGCILRKSEFGLKFILIEVCLVHYIFFWIMGK